MTKAWRKFWALETAQSFVNADPPQAFWSGGVPRPCLGLYTEALEGGPVLDRRSGNDSYDEDHDDIAQDGARHMVHLTCTVLATGQRTGRQGVGVSPIPPPSWRSR